MRQYMIMMDDRTYNLVDEAIGKEVEANREDGDPRFTDSIARLESVAAELSRQHVGTDTPDTGDQATGDPEVLPLVAQLIHANAMQTAALQQAVIEGLQADLDRMHAKYQLITGKINDLCDQDWTPAPRALLAALYPDHEAIERRMRTIRAGRGMSD